jgi:hypothetical protein
MTFVFLSSIYLNILNSLMVSITIHVLKASGVIILPTNDPSSSHVNCSCKKQVTV